ncbi:hypothetical protein soil367_15200 [Hydrocarboniclastica marina]|uniref:Uncharacterized protein n=1 Tax=Hydrocarboniclastica marina TaxID=2259620 RepID=A0A4P7XJE3_9ALTE|nr:hypothetical protein soil367_15200 [Hydrocarboniclastica marina]
MGARLEIGDARTQQLKTVQVKRHVASATAAYFLHRQQLCSGALTTGFILALVDFIFSTIRVEAKCIVAVIHLCNGILGIFFAATFDV